MGAKNTNRRRRKRQRARRRREAVAAEKLAQRVRTWAAPPAPWLGKAIHGFSEIAIADVVKAMNNSFFPDILAHAIDPHTVGLTVSVPAERIVLNIEPFEEGDDGPGS